MRSRMSAVIDGINDAGNAEVTVNLIASRIVVLPLEDGLRKFVCFEYDKKAFEQLYQAKDEAVKIVLQDKTGTWFTTDTFMITDVEAPNRVLGLHHLDDVLIVTAEIL